MIYKKSILYSFCIIMGILMSGCYSFTGSSLDPRVKTINIHYFPNYAPLQNPNLSPMFTDALQLRFQRRTNLSLTNNDDADIILEGEIINYQETPTTVVSGDRAAQNRLTVTVKVRYENNIQLEKGFTRTFSDYEDFDATKSLPQVQGELVERINSRLIDQIFNAIVADW